MSALRVLAEHSILLLLLVCRVVLLALGLGLLTASFVFNSILHGSGEPGGLATGLGWIRATGAALLAGAILLFVSRSWIRIPRRAEEGQGASPGWIPLVGVFLLAQAIAAARFSTDLVTLWREAIAFLDRVGFWKEMQKADQFSGLAFFPVLAVLSVPLLEAAAALSLTLAPLLLLSLFPTRSRLFPRALVMTAIAQASLAVASLLSAHAFAVLAVRVLAEVTSQGGPEAREVIAVLRRIQDVVWPTAQWFCWLVLATMVWVPTMVFSRRIAVAFPKGSQAA